MTIFLLLLAALVVVSVARTVVLMAHDGYGNPSTVPTSRHLENGLPDMTTR
ncbi:hypothetical protein [Planctomonas psychrotolerans]|uniref:hypothetical protein n=1 Tax=Planctomonas psychrotolerans TaxID=2528712 RepID=UPI001D0CFD67|nr:hypothetical protein [Planctomonas psychrotolerans]